VQWADYRGDCNVRINANAASNIQLGGVVSVSQWACLDSQSFMAGFRAGKRTVRGPYPRDGKDHRLSRRRCHYCVCSDLLAILAEKAQMTPKRPRDTNQIAKDESK
jgi:hypothetical protein